MCREEHGCATPFPALLQGGVKPPCKEETGGQGSWFKVRAHRRTPLPPMPEWPRDLGTAAKAEAAPAR